MHYLPTTTLYPDPNDKTLIAVTTQDVEPILEANKELSKYGQKSDWGWHIGRVPNNTINQWLIEYYGPNLPKLGPDFWMWCRRKLDDPNYKYLRVDGPTSSTGFVR